MSNSDLQAVLDNLPKKPGIYKFYDKYGELLYIGKAKVLANRVRSYFQTSRVRNARQMAMVNQIAKIEYNIVPNEQEALRLESNLVFSQQPKYNVLLKSDKSQVYIRIKENKKGAKILKLVRKKTDSEVEYIGPFNSLYDAENLLKTVRVFIPFCQKERFDGAGCEYSSLGLCGGVCAGDEPVEQYNARIEKLVEVLRGRGSELEKQLNIKIENNTENDNYKQAAYWLDNKRTYNRIRFRLSSDKNILSTDSDLDLVSFVLHTPKDNESVVASVFVQNVREGVLVNTSNRILDAGVDDSLVDIIRIFLYDYCFSSSDSVPIYLDVVES